MPKSAKKARSQGPVAAARPKKGRKMHTFPKLSTTSNPSGANTQPKKQPAQQRPIIPFGKTDRILLVGEGTSSVVVCDRPPKRTNKGRLSNLCHPMQPVPQVLNHEVL